MDGQPSVKRPSEATRGFDSLRAHFMTEEDANKEVKIILTGLDKVNGFPYMVTEVKTVLLEGVPPLVSKVKTKLEIGREVSLFSLDVVTRAVAKKKPFDYLVKQMQEYWNE